MQNDVFLPPLEPSSAAQPVTFRMGVIVAFNPSTGTNQVRVAGQVLNNLAMLVSGSETAFQVGQNVGIMVVGSEMFIVGRIAVPGAPSYASTTSAFKTGSTLVTAFSTSPTLTAYASVSLQVPPWATRAAVIGTSWGAINNTGGNLDNLQAFVFIPGMAFGANPQQAVVSTYWQGLNYTNAQSVSVTPGGTLTCNLSMATGLNWPAHAGNSLMLNIVAIFTTA